VSCAAIAGLSACGGGSSGGDKIDSVVSGSVGDGPITGATVTIYNARGELVAEEVSDVDASYAARLHLPRSDFPLTIRVNGGIDLVTGEEPDFEMMSVMMQDSHTVANINPFTTLIVKMAETLPGGINAENILFAKTVMVYKFSFGLDADLMGKITTKKVNAGNVAQIVKASEALGEMVRRSRDLMRNAGTPMSGDDIINAVAVDMADGFLDGMGAAGSNPSVAAVANMVAGQVLVEAMTNSLKVNGINATAVMDQAIATIHPEVAADAMSGSVQLTQQMLNQAGLAVAAAQTVDNSSRLADLADRISRVEAGSLAADASSIVSVSDSQRLNNAIKTTSTAGREHAVNVNLAANDTPAQPVAVSKPVTRTKPAVVKQTPVTREPVVKQPVAKNRSPLISGSPSRAVTASNYYAFRAKVSDADGDALSFKIINKPAWAEFNTSTGVLNGTPANSDAGTYNNIQISVSDGSARAQLSAFSIKVNKKVMTVATGSMNLSWTAPSTRADGTPLSLADIDGYRIYYGASKGNYPDYVQINDGTAQSARVTDLPVGSYNVVMTTFDGDGRESGYSPSVVKKVTQ